jgi:hypothetical protein
MSADLKTKLHPRRFSAMSPMMSAIVGFLVDEVYTTPTIEEIVVTTDGHVLARPQGHAGCDSYLGMACDLVNNLKNLFTAAELTKAERLEAAVLVLNKIPQVHL